MTKFSKVGCVLVFLMVVTTAMGQRGSRGGSVRVTGVTSVRVPRVSTPRLPRIDENYHPFHATAPRTVLVSGYVRANGTVVAPYWRAEAGTAINDVSEESFPVGGIPIGQPFYSTPTRRPVPSTTWMTPEARVVPVRSFSSSTTVLRDGPLILIPGIQVVRPRSVNVLRDANGRIHRSAKVKHDFQWTHPCPANGNMTGACPGYVMDHIKPLATGGADAVENLQWQTTADAKAKDKWERRQ